MKHKATTPISFLLALGVLAGCGSDIRSIGREPAFNSMQVDKDTMPEVANVRVPMPAKQPERSNARAERASLWGGGRGGFFADKRAAAVGDILTVRIDIKDKATLSNQSQTSRTSQSQMGAPTILGYESKLDKILPGLDPEELPQGNLVDLGSTSTNSGVGSVNRNESISLRVAALVLEELPNGNLVIAGRQEVRVNYELRELRIAGIIRKEDIAMDNSISYDKIAEARIAYGGRGQLSRVQKPRYGTEFLDIVLPY